MLHINTNELKILSNTFYGFDDSQLQEFSLLSNVLFQKSPEWQTQGFTNLPDDKNIVEDITHRTARFHDYITDIVVLGIGGSMLGVQVITDALYHTKTIQKFKIHYVDNIDGFLVSNITEKLDLAKTLFLVQTKSGGTPETIAQYLYFEGLVTKSNLQIEDHFIFVTDPEVGFLRKIAEGNSQIVTFEVPVDVGGRFSVLTPIGLVIGVMLDLDMQSMLDGAKNALEKNKPEACLLAKIQSSLLSEGINQTVFMPYCSQLSTLARWYIQLLSESIGKELNLDGETVNTGITPIPAVGATDQHSQMQLFKEGPNDKLIILLEVAEPKGDAVITTRKVAGFEYLQNLTFNTLLKAELRATRTSLTESERPNLTIEVDKVNEFTLGELFMFLELSVAYIGEILQINTFNQPGVERSKVLTREILEGGKE
jgi:glucose-6-phosphate isomerase